MMLTMQNPDDDLIALGRALDEAVLTARAQIDATPTWASIPAEQAAIEAASGPPALLAEKIVQAGYSTPEGAELHARAVAWLGGESAQKPIGEALIFSVSMLNPC